MYLRLRLTGATALRLLFLPCAACAILHIHAVAPARKQPEADNPQKDLPSRAARFRPWGAVQTYRLVLDDIRPAGGRATGSGKSDTASDLWKPWFDDAILFMTDNGQRLVTIGKQPQGTSVDYVEIRQTGNGFGVNTDNYSTKSHLYLDHFRVTRPAPSSPDPVRVEFEATVNHTGATKRPNEVARLAFTAVPLTGAPAPEAVPVAAAAASTAVQSASDPPTTVTVSDVSDTSPTRRTSRRVRR